jgi:hypothetical protein
MTHATSWNAQATGEAPSPRCSAVGVGPDALGSRPPGRGGREFRLSLVAGVPTQGDAGTGRQTKPGTSAATVHRGEASTREAVDPWRAARRVPDRPLDAAPGDAADSPAVRRALSPRACLEGADRVGLELPEARAARSRARRGGHCPVDAGGLAPDKKTPLDVAPISCSSMRAGSCLSQTSAEPGHPRGRRRASVIATATIACLSAAGWRCRPSGGAWRSTFGVSPTISPASISRPFSATSCATCADRSTCSGIAVRSIAGAKSRLFSPRIPDSRCTTSPRTRLNSTRPSMCGPRLTTSSPMEHRTMSGSSASDWPMRRADCVAPSISCGPASTPQISRGSGRGFHYLRRTQ